MYCKQQPWPFLRFVETHGWRGEARQDKTIPVQPIGILGVEAHDFVEENVRHGSKTHWSTGVAGFGLRGHVDGETADGVDAFPVEAGGRGLGHCGWRRKFKARNFWGYG